MENGSKKSKKLSQRLSQALESMEDTTKSFTKIKNTIDAEYSYILKTLNPDDNNDVTKEIKYQFAHYLKNLSKEFDT